MFGTDQPWDDVWSRLYFTIYVLGVMLVVVNLFVALINQTLEDVTGDESSLTYDKELKEYFLEEVGKFTKGIIPS